MFKGMLSYLIIEIIYVLLVGGSFFYLMFAPEDTATKVMLFLAFNVLVRLIFETIAIKYEMHRSLVAIEGMLRRSLEDEE